MARALWIATWALVGVGLFAVTLRVMFPADLATIGDPSRDVVFALAGTSDPFALVRPAEIRRYDARLADHPRLTRLHILSGALFLLLAPLQFVPSLRNRYRNLHRWSGRLLLALAATLMIGAAYFGIGMPFGGAQEAIPMVVFGPLFVIALARAWIAIRQGQQDLHREWMIRAFSVAIGISTMRVVLLAVDYPLTMLRVPPTGVFVISIWIGWLLSIGAAEAWIRRTRVIA